MPIDVDQCANCGLELDDHADRRPCPVCGRTERNLFASAHMQAKAKAYIATRLLQREGGKKVVREILEGDSFTRRTGAWSYRFMMVDRKNDHYKEIVRDADGVLIYYCDEPLTEHRTRKK
jgi:hypothetical protein